MSKYSISYNDIVSINKIKDVYDGIYKNTYTTSYENEAIC